MERELPDGEAGDPGSGLIGNSKGCTGYWGLCSLSLGHTSSGNSGSPKNVMHIRLV